MIRRHSSVKTSGLSTNNKTSAGLNKPAPRSSSVIKKAPERLEDQKKNVKSQLEKFQIATKTPIKTPSTSSNLSSRQSTIPKLVAPSWNQRKLESKPSQKPPSRFAQRLAVSKKQGVLLSPDEIQQLTSKFEALSATIIRLATSNSPISVRSLESLLAKEVTDCLGSAINGAKFAEGFVRETRFVLDFFCPKTPNHFAFLLSNLKGPFSYVVKFVFSYSLDFLAQFYSLKP